MGVLETAARIVELGGAASPGRAARVADMRARFEARTGAFAPEDPWFEERSRAFWCDAITTRRFGAEVADALTPEDATWLGPLERAHRGLFRTDGVHGQVLLVDAWSGAELLVDTMDEASRAELDASAGQLFDARVVGSGDPWVVALLPGAVFHPLDATAVIPPVMTAARQRGLATGDALDALLRMQRTLRSLSRVKAAYAYRVEALSPHAGAVPVRRADKGPT
jgi:hypothetical protein